MVKKIGRVLLLLGFSLVALSTANAGLQKKSPEKQLDALIKEFNKLQSEFQTLRGAHSSKYQKLHAAAKTQAEKTKILAEYRSKMPKSPSVTIAPKISKLLEANTIDMKSEVGLRAMGWVLQNQPGNRVKANQYVKAIMKDHAGSENIGDALAGVQRMSRNNQKGFVDFLRKIIGENKHDKAKAAASVLLAGQLKSGAEKNGSLKDYSDAKELYVSVSEKYGKLKSSQGGTYAAVCKAAMVDFNSPRALGKTVPEIEAEDIDGKTFKLSDYRGKVVVIDFWGDW